MAEVASAYVTLLPSAKGFGRKLDSSIGADTKRSGVGMGAVFGKAFAVAGAAIIGAKVGSFLRGAVSDASDLQQSIGGVQAVFGKYAATVEADSKKAAQALGLSRDEYNKLITVSGAFLKNKGLKDFTGQSRTLLTVGADLAAQFGGSTAEAVGAINAALRGESDPIERYAISLNEAAVNSELLARGQNKLKGPALQQAKTQARIALIMKQSADAQGTFARESDTLAGKQARLSAQWTNMKATLGSALLPILTSVFGFVNDTALPAIRDFANIFKGSGGANSALASFGDSSGRVQERLQQFKTTFASVFAAVKSIVQSTVSIVTSLWRVFGGTLTSATNRALTALLNIIRGVFLIIAGIFKVVAAVLKGDWAGAWAGIKQIARGALSLLKGLVQNGMNAVRTVFSLAGDAIVAVLRAAWRGAVAEVQALPGQIVGALGDLGGMLYDAGVAIIAGLIQGIGDKAAEIPGFLKDKVTSVIPGGVKKFLGINSPSRVMMPLGAGVVEGLIVGMQGQANALTSSLRGITSNIPGAVAFDGAVGAGATAATPAVAAASGQRLYLVLDDGTTLGGYVESRIDGFNGFNGMTERAFT